MIGSTAVLPGIEEGHDGVAARVLLEFGVCRIGCADVVRAWKAEPESLADFVQVGHEAVATVIGVAGLIDHRRRALRGPSAVQPRFGARNVELEYAVAIRGLRSGVIDLISVSRIIYR